jgi:LPXTG-motif cell wall-anchored protein
VTGAGGPTGEVTTAAVGGPGGVNSGGGSPTVAVGAESAQQLPFTGSSSFPLAAVGIVFILCGGGLALRKRRLAD